MQDSLSRCVIGSVGLTDDWSKQIAESACPDRTGAAPSINTQIVQFLCADHEAAVGLTADR
jgi:hypothetical protein